MELKDVQGATHVRRDCQVREVDGGYVIVLHTRFVDDNGKTLDGVQSENVAATGSECAAILQMHFNPAKG